MSSSVFSVGGYGQQLEYDAWVCFWLCEESLRSSGGANCSSRDVRYCFRQVDEGGRGQVGLSDIVPFFEDAVRSRSQRSPVIVASKLFVVERPP